VPGGYASNREREENMKDLFMRGYRRAVAVGEPMPRVLLKFGHWHLYRGRSPGSVLSLGNFVSQLAKSNGKQSFHLAVIINNPAGGFRAVKPDSWLKPLADAAPVGQWTVMDLRPVRDCWFAGKFKLRPELKELILGFDAALMMAGATPGTYERTKR
jgi:hypothetical protein